jgi:hypothetical protein
MKQAQPEADQPPAEIGTSHRKNSRLGKKHMVKKSSNLRAASSFENDYRIGIFIRRAKLKLPDNWAQQKAKAKSEGEMRQATAKKSPRNKS